MRKQAGFASAAAIIGFRIITSVVMKTTACVQSNVISAATTHVMIAVTFVAVILANYFVPGGDVF